MRKIFNIKKYFSIALLVLCSFVIATNCYADNGSGSNMGPGGFGGTDAAVGSTVARMFGQDETAEQLMEIAMEAQGSGRFISEGSCPSFQLLQDRYQSGCWSCLVFEKLTSAFLYAAQEGLPVTQKAGATLLWLGTALWFVFWGLKNVSSFTQVQLGNILNDLFKFLFKVAIAYWFIYYGIAAINKYITTPILSVGAIIGQQFWDDGIATEDYTETIGLTKDDITELQKEELQTKNNSQIIENKLTIPNIKYTGPTAIMPKSIMNSMLAAMNGITNTVAKNMILGNSIMCYSGLKNGGAWYVELWFKDIVITNIFMWFEGVIIWCLGFMLVMAVGYYFIDISFKIGFAILSLPLVMGLWPFGITQDKLFIVISIIAKGSACFAFMAVSTAIGIKLVSESFGGMDELLEKMDELDVVLDERIDKLDDLRSEVNQKLKLFSTSFLMVLFSLMYFYKLVKNTCSDLVNKFFPDKAFGDSTPMHSGATMATSFVARPLKNAASMVGDIATHQVGKAAQGMLKGTLSATTNTIRHPINTVKSIGSGVKTVAKGVKAVGHAITHPKQTAKKVAEKTAQKVENLSKGNKRW